MSIQPPDTEHPDTENTDTENPSTGDPATTPVRTVPPKRTPDYRLRGLDLNAQALAEAPTTGVRRKHPSRRRRRRRLLLQWIIISAVIVGVVLALRAWVVEPFSVTSTSMVPTLQPGTEVLVGKTSLIAGSVGVGDIVVLRKPAGVSCNAGGTTSDHLVERVIALPGQTIRSSGGRIYIDGRVLEEPGWYNVPFGELGPTRIARTTVPAGSYFVMGDNRTDTCDSRRFGPVAKSLLVGTVVSTLARDGHPFLHIQ